MTEVVPAEVRRVGARFLATCPLGEHDGASFVEAIQQLQSALEDAYPLRRITVQVPSVSEADGE